MLDTPCSEVVWSVLSTHSIRQFPLHFPARASPCAITFQSDSTFYSWTLSMQSERSLFCYVLINLYKRSPYVPRLPWLATCGRWNFLRDTDGVHRIWYSLHYLLICLFVFEVLSLLLSTSSNKKVASLKKHQPVVFRVSHYQPLTHLSYSNASVSHPIPLSAVKLFSF